MSFALLAGCSNAEPTRIDGGRRFANRDPGANAAHVALLFAWWDEGKIAPHISATYPLARAGEAIAALANRTAVGKLVVTLD